MKQQAMKMLYEASEDQVCKDMEDMQSRLHLRDVMTSIKYVQGLEVFEDAGDLFIKTPFYSSARFNHTTFNQICNLLRLNPTTINSLSPSIASDALNDVARKRGLHNEKFRANILNGGLGEEDEFRSRYGSRYQRVSDYSVVEGIAPLLEEFGYVPIGDVAGDMGVGGITPIKPHYTGLYDCQDFTTGFTINPDNDVSLDDSPLYASFFWKNSEVSGRACAEIGMIVSRGVCGNHMYHGVTEHSLRKHRHVNGVEEIFGSVREMLISYVSNEWKEQVWKDVNMAKRAVFATTREKVAEKLKSYKPLTSTHVEGIVDRIDHPLAYPRNPMSVWGVAQATTVFSQGLKYEKERVAVDRVGGRIIQSSLN